MKSLIIIFLFSFLGVFSNDKPHDPGNSGETAKTEEVALTAYEKKSILAFKDCIAKIENRIEALENLKTLLAEESEERRLLPFHIKKYEAAIALLKYN